MNTDFIKGVVVPMITPIDKDELIDEAAIRSQVDYVIDGGVSGILLFGSNGEFYVVEEDEIRPLDAFRYTSASVRSAPKSASVLQRWQ